MTRRLAAVPLTAHRDAAYVRVSAVMGRSGEDFLSPSIQLDTIRGASSRTGGTIVAVHEDIDVSGRSMRRDGLEAVMAAARAGQIDRLFVYDLSRWARNAAEGLAELAAIEKLGVEVISATEALDRTTSSGRLTAGMLLLLAEHYSDLVGDRWKGVIKANAERGVLHGRAPLGYVRTERRTVEPDPALGPAVTEAYRRAAAGEPLLAIARDLSRIAGKTVWPRTLRDVLRSPTYLGLVPMKGKTLPGRHAALTDQGTWDVVQARLDAASTVPSRTKEARWSLAGLVRCEGCGRALVRRVDRTPDGHLYCITKQRDGLSSCPGIGAPQAAQVEAVVLDEVRRRLVDVEDETAAEAVRLSRAERNVSDHRAVLDELGRVERSLSVLAVKLAEEVLSDFAYGAAVKQLEERRALLQEQRRVLEVDVRDVRTFAASRDLASALLELWPGMDAPTQNAALRTHVERVIVRRASFRGETVAARTAVAFRDGG